MRRGDAEHVGSIDGVEVVRIALGQVERAAKQGHGLVGQAGRIERAPAFEQIADANVRGHAVQLALDAIERDVRLRKVPLQTLCAGNLGTYLQSLRAVGGPCGENVLEAAFGRRRFSEVPQAVDLGGKRRAGRGQCAACLHRAGESEDQERCASDTRTPTCARRGWIRHARTCRRARARSRAAAAAAWRCSRESRGAAASAAVVGVASSAVAALPRARSARALRAV